jgi:hypothetical protein
MDNVEVRMQLPRARVIDCSEGTLLQHGPDGHARIVDKHPVSPLPSISIDWQVVPAQRGADHEGY